MPLPTDTRRSGKSDTAFRTISEVSEELDVPQHVLRFWETKFVQIRPMKRGGGRRYYRPEDVAVLRRIRTLLYSDGFTIKGVQKLLREGALKVAPAADDAVVSDAASAPVVLAAVEAEDEEDVIDEPEIVVAAAPLPAASAAVRQVDLFSGLEAKAAGGGLTPSQRAIIRDVVAELASVRNLLTATA